MKIVTSIPAALATAVDIVDRNVANQLELSQETFFPLEPVSDVCRFLSSPAPGIQRSSFSVFAAASVANAVSSNIIMASLGDGLWVLNFHVQYVSNYAQLTASGFNLGLSPVSGTQAAVFITLAPVVGGNLTIEQQVKVLVQEDMQLAFFLLTNGVGQAHSANVSVTAEKYF